MTNLSESAARKAKSIAILRSEDVPVLEVLGEIETEPESIRRTEREVVHRTIALFIVAIRGATSDDVLSSKLIDQFGAVDYFTPDEREFINNENPTKETQAQFSWRFECAFVLLWSLGFVEHLGRPTSTCDVYWINDFLNKHGEQGLLKNSQLRAQSEILDAADLIFRYHWAVRNANLNGQATPGYLNSDVVAEWHYALNWLIGCCEEVEWDEISTDT